LKVPTRLTREQRKLVVLLRDRLPVDKAPARHDLAAGNTALAEKRLKSAYCHQGAEKLFREAVEDDPNYGQGHLTLGLILAKDQKFAEAEAETDQAVKLNPTDATALAAAGKVKVRLGKIVEGIALLRKAVALAPASPAAHLDLGMVLAENFDLAGALTETGEAVRLAPGSGMAHLNRGRGGTQALPGTRK
jgi:tetratricopeptide (TPR) repeat protein